MSSNVPPSGAFVWRKFSTMDDSDFKDVVTYVTGLAFCGAVMNDNDTIRGVDGMLASLAGKELTTDELHALLSHLVFAGASIATVIARTLTDVDPRTAKRLIDDIGAGTDETGQRLYRVSAPAHEGEQQ